MEIYDVKERPGNTGSAMIERICRDLGYCFFYDIHDVATCDNRCSGQLEKYIMKRYPELDDWRRKKIKEKYNL